MSFAGSVMTVRVGLALKVRLMSTTGTVLVAPGTRVVADFPGLGRAELVFD